MASCPLYLRGYSVTPCLGGWVEPGFVGIQTLFSLMEVNPDYLSHSRYTDYGTADSPFEESRCK